MLLHAIERGPDSPAATDLPPLVFLHGLFGRGRNFGFFQRRLSETRRTVAFDLRNHGDSPHGPMDYPTMAQDVLETLDHLKVSPAIVVGHSMGGKTGMMLALRHPEIVTKLLVADIAPGEGGFSQGHDLAARLAALPLPPHLTRADADALLSSVIREPDVRNLMLQNLDLGENPHWSIGIHEIAAAMPAIVGWPSISDGTHYDGPTLFVAGGRSDYIQPVNYPEMKRLFPNYRLTTIEGAGHWVHAEKPNEFFELLTQFIGSDQVA
ncbi:alpha/beta fold hydrolase [Acetobacter conturbans]|uniref:Alpha/beta fold hydrolase n=1 Tax=Acetobacter conturbans TaxID=1737472 RepID=A0ABX0JZU0_9PROT|nr:alpha/beta fold hydrolase [Acetobacter conturbans]NHN87588.1 alpha/beta fold hydrolase [Acetobacter conturbans]